MWERDETGHGSLALFFHFSRRVSSLFVSFPSCLLLSRLSTFGSVPYETRRPKGGETRKERNEMWGGDKVVCLSRLVCCPRLISSTSVSLLCPRLLSSPSATNETGT